MTSHICSDQRLFSDCRRLEKPQQVTLGDGHELEAVGRGTVYLAMKMPKGKTSQHKLRGVLFMPRLSYNLLSVSKVAEAGKTTKFDDDRCRITGDGSRLFAMATKVDYQKLATGQQANAVKSKQESKENIWHRHLGVKNLKKLARDNMIDGFDFDA